MRVGEGGRNPLPIRFRLKKIIIAHALMQYTDYRLVDTTGHIFGTDVVNKFAEKHGFDLIIRAHQVCFLWLFRKGYQKT